MSRRPNSLTARSIIALTSSSELTSAFWKTALPPFSLHSRTTDSPPATLRSATTTEAPSWENRIAVARPIPLAAPVITATLFSSLRISAAPRGCLATRPRPDFGCHHKPISSGVVSSPTRRAVPLHPQPSFAAGSVHQPPRRAQPRSVNRSITERTDKRLILIFFDPV